MMPNNRYIANGERGQTLILFSFMIAVLLLVTMSVVDVGFFLHARQKAQQTADAAALAGSQELPDNPAQAEVVARDYVARNDLDPAQTDVTFSCTSDTQIICLDGDGRYDTIRVTPHVQSPTFFGAVLTFIGVSNCWVEGCTAQASAAGCRGACGPIGTGPADIMTILDHSGSMSTTDLANAKGAINSMFGDFNDQYQQIGVSLTPPTDPTNMCDTANNWTDPLVWLQAPLNNNFQLGDGTLDPNSPPVYYANCADRPSSELTSGNPWQGGHSNLGAPMEAAANELAANGRPDVTWGIIMLTDGAANMAPSNLISQTTGQLFCTAEAAVTSSAGDNNGYQTNASGLCADGGAAGQDPSSGNNTNTSCTDTGKDKHQFSNFGLAAAIPSSPTPTIDGIEVRLDSWATSGASTRRVCVQLSWNGGSSWTSAQSVNLSGTTEATKILGGPTSNWGRTWTTSNLSDANFRVRVIDVASNTSTTFNLDAVAVNVYYHTVDPSIKGPCDYAMQKATAAKALGIEVYMIGYGLDPNETCSGQGELPSSPYYNMTAQQILTAMATDADHFFNAPQNEDLTNIFAAIGGALTLGSRLVE